MTTSAAARAWWLAVEPRLDRRVRRRRAKHDAPVLNTKMLRSYVRTCAPAHLRTCAPAYLRTCVPPYPRACKPNTSALAYPHTRTRAHLHTCIPARGDVHSFGLCVRRAGVHRLRDQPKRERLSVGVAWRNVAAAAGRLVLQFTPKALTLLAHCIICHSTPNVRAKRVTTAGRQARAGENVLRTTRPGLAACRWLSA